MIFPRIKKQVAVPLVAAAVFALAAYVLFNLAPAQADTPAQEMPVTYEWLQKLREVGTWIDILQAALWISVAIIIVRLLGTLVFALFRKRKGYEASNLTRDLFALVAYVVFVAFILHSFFPSLSFSALLPGSALLGVIIGLALQDTLGNLFAGISLHADKPFQVGDVITVGKWSGVIESITWRAAKIRTFQNHIVLVSNSSMSKESIEVCPRDNANARIVFFGALYSDSPAKVIHVVREAVREVDNVLRYMTPVVRIRDFGDSSVDYEVKYWLENYARYNDTDALVRQRIWYAFRRNELSFAFPTRTLQIEPPPSADDAKLNGDLIIDRLAAIDIFSPLSADELRQLASNSQSHVYAPGELIIREGERGASMFILNRGSVNVHIDDKGRPRTVATLNEGDFFGEMALFTGEPRTANISAVEETEVLEIKHDAMRHLFKTNPDLVESLSRTITERRAGLAARAQTQTNEETDSAGLLASIKRFFGLT